MIFYLQVLMKVKGGSDKVIKTKKKIKITNATWASSGKYLGFGEYKGVGYQLLWNVVLLQ